MIKLKITEVDKETKKSKKDYILPIASAGIGLGLTCFLMHTGVIDYNNLASLDGIENAIRNITIDNPTFREAPRILAEAIDKVGIQGFILAEKSLSLAGKVIKPIKDSEKFKNSKINHTIQKIKKFGGKNEIEEGEEKTSKAFVGLAKGALGIGAKAFLIATNRMDYSGVFNWDKLPHKLAVIADAAKNIDMNKAIIGIDAIKSVGSFVKGRIEEKKEGNIPLINFKAILHNIGEQMKNTGKFPTTRTLQSIGREMVTPSLEMEANKGGR